LKNIRTIIEQTESEAWRKWVGMLLHEIMNSMAPIISLADTFLAPELNSHMINKTMQTIYWRSKGLVEFVQNHKRLADLPAPQVNPFHVRELLEDITTLLKAQDIWFTYDVHPDDLIIKADNMQIGQVLINLIKNAWEASCRNERLLDRFTCQQSYRTSFIAGSAVIHVKRFIFRIENQRNLVCILFVKSGRMTAGLIKRFGVGGPMHQIVRKRNHNVRSPLANAKIEHGPMVAVAKNFCVGSKIGIVASRTDIDNRIERITHPMNLVFRKG
jgi:hypothetical protein